MPRVKIEQGNAAAQLSAELGPDPRQQLSPQSPAMMKGAGERRATIPFDMVNEQTLIVAAMGSKDERKFLVTRAPADHFFAPNHPVIWSAFGEMVRRDLDYTPALVVSLSGGKVDENYLRKLAALHKASPPNIRHHLAELQKDKARVEAARGPVAELLKTLQDPRAPIEQLRSIAEKIKTSFSGYADRKHLRDPMELLREARADRAARIAGHAIYPFGLEGFDLFEDGEYRLIPGAAPGLMSVVVGIPGGGKSTFTAQLASALYDQGHTILYGAWEMQDTRILELIAAMRLGFSRKALMTGRITPDQQALIDAEEEKLSERIRFLQMPFGRDPSGKKVDNDRNLDMIHGYIADSACTVFVADLWKRCLRFTDPDDEEQALIRQQAILQETRVHGILVQQLRAKDVESRKDKRPTREAIKGSGAWFEVPDNIFGVHRPGLFKRIPDDTLEVCILKQRYGIWPAAVAFDWDAAYGSVANGRSIQYDSPDDDSAEADAFKFGSSRRKDD